MIQFPSTMYSSVCSKRAVHALFHNSGNAAPTHVYIYIIPAPISQHTSCGCNGRVARCLGSRNRFMCSSKLVWADLRAGAGVAADCSEVACAAAVPGCIKRREMKPSDHLADDHRHLCELIAGRRAAVRTGSARHCNVRALPAGALRSKWGALSCGMCRADGRTAQAQSLGLLSNIPSDLVAASRCSTGWVAHSSCLL